MILIASRWYKPVTFILCLVIAWLCAAPARADVPLRNALGALGDFEWEGLRPGNGQGWNSGITGPGVFQRSLDSVKPYLHDKSQRIEVGAATDLAGVWMSRAIYIGTIQQLQVGDSATFSISVR